MRFMAISHIVSTAFASFVASEAPQFGPRGGPDDAVQAAGDASGGNPRGDSRAPAISADGAWVVFESDAADLVAGDTNGVCDIFRVSRLGGAIERVSLSIDGAQADGRSFRATVSGDGDRVAFASDAANLAPDDTNRCTDIFVRAYPQGSVFRASVGPRRLQASGPSTAPDLADNGKWLVFASTATNLTAEDTNAVSDVFRYELRSSAVERVSLASTGAQGRAASREPQISGNGTWIAFTTDADDLALSDANGRADALVNALPEGRTWCVSLAAADARPAGGAAPSLSHTGRRIAFVSESPDLVAADRNAVADVFVRYIDDKRTVRLSCSPSGGDADGASGEPRISGDGQFVVFSSAAGNLVPGDSNAASDVFLCDLQSLRLTRISVAPGGESADGASSAPDISADGRFVVYQSAATNLTPGDTNGRIDIFVYDVQRGETRCVSSPPAP